MDTYSSCADYANLEFVLEFDVNINWTKKSARKLLRVISLKKKTNLFLTKTNLFMLVPLEWGGDCLTKNLEGNSENEIAI